MELKFEVVLLDDVDVFLNGLDVKTREKVLYNLWKSRMINDSELFKKLTDDIWEFRTLFQGKQIRLLSFGDKDSKIPKVVVCTHGFIKKVSKVPQKEIDKAIGLMREYYDFKK